MSAGNRVALAVYAGTSMNDPSLIARLGTMNVPSLVLWGESDKIADVQYGRAFAAAIPKARFDCSAAPATGPRLRYPTNSRKRSGTTPRRISLPNATWHSADTDFSSSAGRSPLKSKELRNLCSDTRKEDAEELRARHSRIVVVHTPVHASRVNQIELYFVVLRRKVLTRNDVHSLSESIERIHAFRKRYSVLDKPFAWTFTRHELERELCDPLLQIEPLTWLPMAA